MESIIINNVSSNIKIYECRNLILKYNINTGKTLCWLPNNDSLCNSMDRGIVKYYACILLGMEHIANQPNKLNMAIHTGELFNAMLYGYMNFGKNNTKCGYNIVRNSESKCIYIIRIFEKIKLQTTPYSDIINYFNNTLLEYGITLFGENVRSFLWNYLFQINVALNPIAKFFNNNPEYTNLMLKMLMNAINSKYAKTVWDPRPNIINVNNNKIQIDGIHELIIDKDILYKTIEYVANIFQTHILNTDTLITMLGQLFENDYTTTNDTNCINVMLGWLILSCTCIHFDKFEVNVTSTTDDDWTGLSGDITIYKIRYTDPDIQSRFDHLDYFISDTGVPNYGFHGSMIGNWYNIFGNGIQVGGTKNGLHFNGAVYGTGIYLSNDSNLSHTYCGNTSHDNLIMMGVFQVDPSLEPYKKTNNIYVVPEPNNICLKYVILANKNDFTKNTTLINKYFANISKTLHSSQRRIFSDAARRRIEREYRAYCLGITVAESIKLEKHTGGVARLTTGDEECQNMEDDIIADYDSEFDSDEDEYEEDSDYADDNELVTTSNDTTINNIESPIIDNSMSITIDEHNTSITEDIIEVEKVEVPQKDKLWFTVNVSTEPNAPGDVTCWIVRVCRDKFIDPDEIIEHRKNTLYRQLYERNINHVEFEVDYPNEYPFAPPFVRVLFPRFEYRTGHITLGGSICNKLLTKDGWSPAYTLDKVLLDVVTNITNCMDDPNYENTGRLDIEKWNLRYTKKEAIEAHTRMLSTHSDWNT